MSVTLADIGDSVESYHPDWLGILGVQYSIWNVKAFQGRMACLKAEVVGVLGHTSLGPLIPAVMGYVGPFDEDFGLVVVMYCDG